MRSSVQGLFDTTNTAQSSQNVLPFPTLIKQQDGIYQCTRFHDCIQLALHANKKIFAIFDIDNTLMVTVGYKPNQTLKRQSGYGSDIWFSHLSKQVMEDPDNAKSLFMSLLQ